MGIGTLPPCMRPGNRFQAILGSPLLQVTLLLGLLGLILDRSLWRNLEPDEIEALHSGWLVALGDRPYLDFFQQHNPLHYHVLAGVLGLFGESAIGLLACRVLHFGFFLLILLAVYRIAVDLFSPRAALASLVLLTSSLVFANKGIEVRPDVPQVLFGLIALGSFLRHAEDRRARHLVLGSVALGLAFLFLQKAVFMMLALGALSLLRVAMGRMTWRELALSLACLLATVAPFYAWVFASGAWELYYVSNFQVNTAAEGGFSPVFYLLKNARQNTVLWAFAALGLVLFLRRAREHELGVVALALVASLWAAERPWPYYTLPALPLLALVAARAVERAFEHRPVLAQALIFIGAAPGLYFLAAKPYRSNVSRLATIEQVAAITTRDDLVHDPRLKFNVFRRDLDYVWHSVEPGGVLTRFQLFVDHPYDLAVLVRERRPKVISIRELERAGEPGLMLLYEPSMIDDELLLLSPTGPARVAQASQAASGAIR